MYVQSMITTRLPGIGEQVIAGFRASRERVDADDEMKFAIVDGVRRYGVDLRIGAGEVTRHYFDERRIPDLSPYQIPSIARPAPQPRACRESLGR